MKVQIMAKNYNLSQKLTDIIEKKVQRLDKYFSESSSAKIVCSKIKDQYKLELTIKDKGMLFRSEVSSDNMYQNIDLALPKVEKQIVKYSSKLKDKLHKEAIEAKEWLFFDDDDKDETLLPMVQTSVSKIKSFDITPLSVEDAMMNLDNSDHAFYIYLNKEDNKVNIMYRRSEGGFGIIEPKY